MREMNTNNEESNDAQEYKKAMADVNAVDVLWGRDKLAYCHQGNAYFRHIVRKYCPMYQNTKLRDRKAAVIHSILREVEKKEGRFLRRKGGKWEESLLQEVYKKIGHALRSAKPLKESEGEELQIYQTADEFKRVSNTPDGAPAEKRFTTGATSPESPTGRVYEAVPVQRRASGFEAKPMLNAATLGAVQRRASPHFHVEQVKSVVLPAVQEIHHAQAQPPLHPRAVVVLPYSNQQTLVDGLQAQYRQQQQQQQCHQAQHPVVYQRLPGTQYRTERIQYQKQPYPSPYVVQQLPQVQRIVVVEPHQILPPYGERQRFQSHPFTKAPPPYGFQYADSIHMPLERVA